MRKLPDQNNWIYIGDFVVIAHATTRQSELKLPIAITCGNDCYFRSRRETNFEDKEDGYYTFGNRSPSQLFSYKSSSKESNNAQRSMQRQSSSILKSGFKRFKTIHGNQKIVRLCFIGKNEQKDSEFAKFNSDDGHFLLSLIDNELCQFEVEIVSMPPKPQLMDDIILSIKAFLNIPKYKVHDKHNISRNLLTKPVDEDKLDNRRSALIKLFSRIGLKSNITNKEFSFDLNEINSGELIDGGELSKHEMMCVLSSSHQEVRKHVPCREGMKLTLRPYQEKALAFMYDRETKGNVPDINGTSLSPLWEQLMTTEGIPFYFSPYSGELSLESQVNPVCKGGILGDEMGLGKTIQTLSLIHTHRPEDKENKEKQLLGLQWMPSTLIICPLNVLGQWKDEAIRCLGSENVRVEVFYGDSRSQSLFDYSLSETPLIYLTTYHTLMSEHGDSLISRDSSPIYKRHWQRIILDEGHYIKERKTKMAKACFALSSDYRWVVTGTPIVNRLDDLFSLLQFIKFEPWNQPFIWKHFVSNLFAKKNPDALKRVQNILAQIMIRRTKQMKDENGNLIIQMPPKFIETKYFDFSSEERDIYDKLLKSSQMRLHWLKGSGLADYSHVFQLLLRLRQMCIHASLLPNFSKTHMESENSVPEFLELQSLIDKHFASHNCDHNTTSFSQSVVSELQSGSSMIDCPICFETVDIGVILPCLHRTCQQCIFDYLERRESEGEKGECPICRAECGAKDILQLVSTNSTSEEKDGEHASSERQRTLFVRSASFKKSTKLLALEKELKSIQQENPKTKTVVFSQWTSVLDLIEVCLKDNDFKFARLDGSMNQAQRQNSLDIFRNCSDITILIASLRSSGVGLNLTHASRLILFDPWWNASVENQAIDRIHRIGQMNPVYVSRYIIKETVEEKILAIQERKTKLLGMLTDESKITLNDLMDLLK